MKPELMSPCSDWVSLNAAIDAGADAVYFGLKGLNMRMTARNFEESELSKVCNFCHEKGIRAYLTINTIVFTDEIPRITKMVELASKSGIDAVICWDMAVIESCRRIGMPFIISTQASVSNAFSMERYRELGAKRIVLARECTLEEIKKIKSCTDLEVEVFVHGAMCVSVSGRCFMSEHLFGKSANRGECLQPCRRKYLIKDPEEDHEMILGEDYVISPKDLCTLPFIDKLIDAGIDAFKIEGRARSPEYVKYVTSAYRQAIDLHQEGNLTKEKKEELVGRCAKVYNRGFSDGFYLGRPIADWTDDYGSKSEFRKEYVGRVKNFYGRINVAEIYLEAASISLGDEIMIQGPSTGVHEMIADSIEIDNKKVESASKGESAALKVGEIVRKNDKVFRIRRSSNQQRRGP